MAWGLADDSPGHGSEGMLFLGPLTRGRCVEENAFMRALTYRPRSYHWNNNNTDSEMAGRHRARFRSIQIIRTGVVAAKDCKRPHTMQYHVRFSPSYVRWTVTNFLSLPCLPSTPFVMRLPSLRFLTSVVTLTQHPLLPDPSPKTDLQDQVPPAPPDPAAPEQEAARHLQGHAPHHLLQVNPTPSMRLVCGVLGGFGLWWVTAGKKGGGGV